MVKDPGTNNGSLTVLLALVGLAAVVLFFVGLVTDTYWLRMVTKPIPVLSIALWVYTGERGRYSTLVTGGLLLSVIGDIMLEWGEKTFLVGVLAFLFAHIFYIGAFFTRERALKPGYALPFVVWGVFIFALVYSNLGGMVLPVGIYIFVICVMMWRASAQIQTEEVSQRNARAGAVGAVLFGLSDTLIAVNRWYAPMPELRYLNIALYWLGQLGIGLSTRRKVE